MPTLHIEHPISDLDTWLGAFNQFAEARRDAGVIKGFLESVVWQSRDLSPGLAGAPMARVLREVEAATPG